MIITTSQNKPNFHVYKWQHQRESYAFCGIFRELDLSMINHIGSIISFIDYFAIMHKFASHLYPPCKGVRVKWQCFQVAFLFGAVPCDLHLAAPIVCPAPDHCQGELWLLALALPAVW